jgi:hypothetical protein
MEASAPAAPAGISIRSNGTAAPVEFATSSGKARIVSVLDGDDLARWERAFDGHAKDHRYHRIAAETLAGQFDHRYLFLENAANGEVAMQQLFFVRQDLTAGMPGKLRAMLNWPRKLFPGWLQLRMLMLGCSASEGSLDSTQPWAVDALGEALAEFARSSKVSIVLLKDYPSHYREALKPLLSRGYSRAPSMPACGLKLDFASFEEFLQERVSYSFRKNLRRKFKKLAAHPPLAFEVVTDVSHVADEIYPLYTQTFQRSELRFEELTKDFLVRIGREMPERARYFLWRQNGKIVAFALCIVHGDTIHDLNVGLDYAVALDLHLYFVTWRDVVQWALDNGLKRYYTAPLNYDPKFHLRMELAPLDLYAWHTSRLINPIFRIALRYLQPARHDKGIQKFPNAHEL